MAAGLGFKDFTTGEVLTAADVDGYLMQGVLVFASSAARDAAITSPQEGQFAFLKDTNTTMYYTGSAWTNLDTTGLTNPMTTTGDMIYSSPGSTPVRIGIGSAGQVLTVASGIPSWATPASGGKIAQVVNATYSTETSTTSTSYGDIGLSASITPSAASSKVLVILAIDAILKTGNSGYGEFALLKSTTVLKYFGNAGNSANAVSNGVGGVMLSYLDSPSTTSSTTYKAQFKSSSSGTTIYVNTAGTNVGTSSITLMEVLA